MSEYSELKKRAEAATAGPWIEQDDEDSAAGAIFIVPESDTWIPPICRITAERDAAYVAAANPHEILGMIAEIDQLKSERAELIRAMEVLLLHVKPAKMNAVALNHAYQVLSKFKAVQP